MRVEEKKPSLGFPSCGFIGYFLFRTSQALVKIHFSLPRAQVGDHFDHVWVFRHWCRLTPAAGA